MSAHAVRADSEKSKEYQIKAAFLYNFIKFVDWPEEKPSDEKTITIGIIGKDPFGSAFEPLKDKQAKDKKVVIKQFESVEESPLPREQVEAIKKCHVLFICRSEVKQIKRIIDSVKGHSVLTVGDMEDFLESGGIINFVKQDEKVRFEINNAAAKKSRLDIRSQLLRLAKRVTDEQTSNGAQS
ncbi:MAG: hypothetical protein A2Z25_19080 [Planctomycetes bacterium RBG_16_55_9]|nr:MAG: hypothetical protein A2Z25_19080 [Planctomycetes bacterium RBG_16_55_9]